MNILLTAFVGRQLSCCNITAEKLNWIGMDADIPQPPINAFPTGPIVEIRMDREEGGCYLWRAPLKTIDEMSIKEILGYIWRRLRESEN